MRSWSLASSTPPAPPLEHRNELAKANHLRDARTRRHFHERQRISRHLQKVRRDGGLAPASMENPMTPLTAEKIAELQQVLGSIDEARMLVAHGEKGAAAHFQRKAKDDGYLFLCKHGEAILSLAKRVAGAPVGACPVYAPDSGVGAASIWFDGAIAADRISGKRVALVEIVGGEE
jgi:hypothetical protein